MNEDLRALCLEIRAGPAGGVRLHERTPHGTNHAAGFAPVRA